jgi:hypothetical protein
VIIIDIIHIVNSIKIISNILNVLKKYLLVSMLDCNLTEKEVDEITLSKGAYKIRVCK